MALAEAIARPVRRRHGAVATFVLRLIREKPLGAVGGAIFVLFLFCGLFADFLAPYGMNQISPIAIHVRRVFPGSCAIPGSSVTSTPTNSNSPGTPVSARRPKKALCAGLSSPVSRSETSRKVPAPIPRRRSSSRSSEKGRR